MTNRARPLAVRLSAPAQDRRKTLTHEKLLWMYERMTLIRQFEERLKWLVETGVPVGAAQ